MSQDKLNYIADLIEQGFTSGFAPTWSIKIEEDDNEEEVRLQEIAKLVKEGLTSGYYPTWKIEIE
jgi:hypothetical protein